MTHIVRNNLHNELGKPLTKSKPKEYSCCFLRAAPSVKTLLEVISFVLVGVIVGIFASWLSPCRDGNNESVWHRIQLEEEELYDKTRTQSKG